MEPIRERNRVAGVFSAWGTLILFSLLCGSGCEEEPPPMMDADTPFATILAQGTDMEVCVLTYYKLSDLRELRAAEDNQGEVSEGSEEEQLIVAIWRLTEEVQNVGFRGAVMLELEGKFDFDSAGRYFETLELKECVDLLREVQALVPDDLPDEPEERWRAVNEIGAGRSGSFFPLDERYRRAHESGQVEKAMAAFIRKNASALSYLN